MISGRDVNYIKNICEETGADVATAMQYSRATCCAEFVARHHTDADVIERYTRLYKRLTDEDEPILFEAHMLFQQAAENGVDFLRISDTYRDASLCMVALFVIKEMYPNAKKQKQGRISINDLKFDYETNFVMAAGIAKAYNLIVEIRDLATSIKTEQRLPGMFGHQAPAFNFVLMLDDMGIRGKQLVYAVEYYDNNTQLLVSKLQRVDENLLKYINKQTALNYKPDDPIDVGYLAVPHGASSTDERGFMDDQDYIMNVYTYREYAEADVKPIETDWSSMDIVSGTSKAQALAIAEHNGFTLLFESYKGDSFGTPVSQLVLFNDATGDFLEANSVKVDDVCYGGVRIILARREQIQRAMLNTDRGVHGNTESFDDNNWTLYECDHDRGMFRQYRSVPPVSAKDVPWDKYPLNGMVSLPMPMVFNDHLTFSFVNRPPENLSFLRSDLHDESYTISGWANFLAGAEMLPTMIDDGHKYIYSRILNDKYRAFADHAYLSIKDASTIAAVFRLSVVLSGIEYEEVDSYIAAILQYLEEDLSRHKAQLEDGNGWQRDTVLRCETRLNALRELDLHPDALDRYIVSQFYDGVEEPAVSELPADALNWMHQYAPESYKTLDDWYLYGNMRNAYQRDLARNSNA